MLQQNDRTTITTYLTYEHIILLNVWSITYRRQIKEKNKILFFGFNMEELPSKAWIFISF